MSLLTTALHPGPIPTVLVKGLTGGWGGGEFSRLKSTTQLKTLNPAASVKVRGDSIFSGTCTPARAK